MIRAFSFGGGTQSMAALVLAARGELDYPLFLFSNVGDDSEHPDTLVYLEQWARPYARDRGIELVEVRRGGKYASLLDRVQRRRTSVPIPMRMDRSGAPGNRTCTYDFKISVVAKELRRRGATREQPATVGLGITVDEIERARTPFDPRLPAQLRDYPLLTLKLTRHDCASIITDEGLPVPPKSACWFCPFHTAPMWRDLRRGRPDLFERACSLEEDMQQRRSELGRDAVWMTDQGVRERATLRELHDRDVDTLFDDDEAACESGYCMT